MRRRGHVLQRLSSLKPRDCSKWMHNLSPAAIILGTSLNILEAVSIGLLLFPPAGQHAAFTGLQNQSMSLYIMSTVVSQVTLTLGGSALPSAMGSMLAEAIPFLRSIATSIHKELGNGHPGTLPTTMVAYALTSLLLGAVFFVLAALRCGSLAGYFPRTVMTGVVGAVGVSLFLQGLEITLPRTSPHLSFNTLFEKTHLPLLAASLGPAIFLSLSTRLSCFPSLIRNSTLYVPLFCCAVGGIFWVVVAACSRVTIKGLASAGWLFAAEEGSQHAPAVAEWDYWTLFDFGKVQWRALSAGIRDIILLVLIGTLSLPIFTSAAALEFNLPNYNLNHDFVGHGISNVVAGAIGALPNLFVYSNTRFFERAGGRRREGAFVALFTFAFFFVSFRVLPYVPTIQASALVLFIGIELTLEALWDSSASLIWCEWSVVAGTTLACTFIGFAPGIGVGLAIVLILQFWHHLCDTQLRIIQPCANVRMNEGPYLPPVFPLQNIVAGSLYKEFDCTVTEERPSSSHSRSNEQMLPPIIRFRKYADFLVIPQMERMLDDVLAGPYSTVRRIILSLEDVEIVETCVAESVQRQVKKFAETQTSLDIVVPRTIPVIHDLRRGELELRWHSCFSAGNPADDHTNAYETLEDAIRDCRYGAFSRSFAVEREKSLATSLAALIQVILEQENANTLVPYIANLHSAGLVVRKVDQGEAIACATYPFQPSFIILEGLVAVRRLHAEPSEIAKRRPIREAIAMAVKAVFRRQGQTIGGCTATTEVFRFEAGPKVIKPHSSSCAHAVSDSCWILDIDPVDGKDCWDAIDLVRRQDDFTEDTD